MPSTIALLTDFGLRDAYVGMMQGVIATLAPQARLISLTHEIPPGDIYRAAFELWRSFDYFPSNTIFLAIVDPGVGTSRRSLALAWTDRFCVGPDNGVFTYLIEATAPTFSVTLEMGANTHSHLSATFHGRDIFAPAAAQLANGMDIRELGPPADDLARLSLPLLDKVDEKTVRGEILHSDRFGDLITSIGFLKAKGDKIVLEPWLSKGEHILFAREKIRVIIPNGVELQLSTTFSDVAPGEALAYIGSAGLLELAVNQGRAEVALSLKQGQEILLTQKG
jgi:S-adenosylmethionine hydrolase